jgi:hypothetical protein
MAAPASVVVVEVGAVGFKMSLHPPLRRFTNDDADADDENSDDDDDIGVGDTNSSILAIIVQKL